MKKEHILIIFASLCDLNKYIEKERINKFLGAKIKKEMTEICRVQTLRKKKIKNRSKIIFSWYCKNKKKDPDNISFSKKFILDGLVLSGVIKNDGWRQISGFEDKFFVDKKNERIEIEIEEEEEEVD